MYCWRDGPLCHMCLNALPPPPPVPIPEPDPEPKGPRVIIEELCSEEQSSEGAIAEGTGDNYFPVGIGDNCFLATTKDKPALLIDTGAGDNICGSRFVHEVEKHLPPRQTIGWSPLERPHPVSGVGNDTIFAKWRVNIPICLPGGDVTSYDAMYLEDNNTPGLLGTTAMQNAGTIIDLRAGQMHIYSGNTRNIVIDTSRAANFRRYNMTQSKQGHIYLPCSNFHEAVRTNSASSSSS